MWVNWYNIICDFALLNHAGLLVRGAHFAQAIVSEHSGKVSLIEVEPALYFVHFPEDAIDLAKQVRAYVQHVGCGLSSRQAEDSLLRLNYLEQAHQEAVRRTCRPQIRSYST